VRPTVSERRHASKEGLNPKFPNIPTFQFAVNLLFAYNMRGTSTKIVVASVYERLGVASVPRFRGFNGVVLRKNVWSSTISGQRRDQIGEIQAFRGNSSPSETARECSKIDAHSCGSCSKGRSLVAAYHSHSRPGLTRNENENPARYGIAIPLFRPSDKRRQGCHNLRLQLNFLEGNQIIAQIS
jgi:hypothetical protein